MRRTYTYSEAVKILGGKDHPVVAAMDKLLGGALLAGSLGLWEVLDLFDAKPDFTRLFSDLANKVSEKRRELGRYDRTQRLQAAHAVVVVTAFFETLRSLDLPFSLSAQDDEHVATFAPFDLHVPLPSAARPYEENLGAILDFYQGLTNDLFAVMSSLAVWDDLNDTQQDQTTEAIEPLPAMAVGRYEELFRQLAVDFPEVAFWCSVEDHRATRSALARLEEALREATTDHTADERLAELAGVYGAALSRPLVRSGEVPAGLRIPTLGEAYVDPRFQVLATSVRSTVPSMAEVWHRLPERSDLYAYLVGYLTSPVALVAPLLVLGDPGSGKSVLTEMLAARLPAADFTVVRVELRSTPVDADLVRQIEHGLHRLLDEPVSWAGFARQTGGALPVVILDGLDELMQATGMSQTRYLTVIAEFQEKLLAKNRPAVFVVTSRLSVCAGVELPEWSHVVRLLPFSDVQVRQWLDVWNAGNQPLPAEVALSYPALAEQPLLLLLLALYDAVDSSLQRDHASLSQGQLYERLFREFGRREVTKSSRDRADADLQDDVETELERLSVVALAMYNRGAQWVAEHEVTADLASLLGVESPNRSAGTRTPLSAGESVLGRFFFVQTSEAVREDHTTLRTYEFLHATFGEYLVARYIWRTLLDLSRADSVRSRRKSTVDDTELYSVLSFTALPTSKPVLDFLREFAGEADRDGLFDLVVRLFAARNDRRLDRGAYEPNRMTDSARDATYSLNLVSLALVLREKVYAPELGVSVEDWRREALFWKSRLSSAEWASVVRGFYVQRDRDRHFVVNLRVASGDADPDWVLMSEPYVTLDDVALTLRDMVTPLAATNGIGETAALIALSATPVEKCLPVLQRLFDSSSSAGQFAASVCARIGRGGDDLAILSRFGQYLDMEDAEGLDAWLRLHERGFRFPEDREYPDVLEYLGHCDIIRVTAGRPDLLKRAKAVADELRLGWPPRAPLRFSRDRAH